MVTIVLELTHSNDLIKSQKWDQVGLDNFYLLAVEAATSSEFNQWVISIDATKLNRASIPWNSNVLDYRSKKLDLDSDRLQTTNNWHFRSVVFWVLSLSGCVIVRVFLDYSKLVAILLFKGHDEVCLHFSVSVFAFSRSSEIKFTHLSWINHPLCRVDLDLDTHSFCSIRYYILGECGITIQVYGHDGNIIMSDWCFHMKTTRRWKQYFEFWEVKAPIYYIYFVLDHFRLNKLLISKPDEY